MGGTVKKIVKKVGKGISKSIQGGIDIARGKGNIGKNLSNLVGANPAELMIEATGSVASDGLEALTGAKAKAAARAAEAERANKAAEDANTLAENQSAEGRASVEAGTVITGRRGRKKKKGATASNSASLASSPSTGIQR